jgi:hypothetical protein
VDELAKLNKLTTKMQVTVIGNTTFFIVIPGSVPFVGEN